MLNLVHAIHDFLPRHRAGSEIYAYELARALMRRGHRVTVVCAEYDPAREHGAVRWRVEAGVAVVEIVNNWVCDTLEEAAAPPLITRRLGQALDAIGPDVLHVHNLLNLSLDLPAVARSQGIPAVATLHDYTLVCPSGGQRLHAAADHICRAIEPDRCARCFRDSAFGRQMAFAPVAARTGSNALRTVAAAMRRYAPAVARRAAAVAAAARPVRIRPEDITMRMDRARAAFDGFLRVVSPSRSLADELGALGFDRSRIEVSDYGMPALNAALPTLHTGPLRVGFVGTLVWHKGVHVLLEAVSQLPAGTVDVFIYGDPMVHPSYATELHNRATGRAVHFMAPFGAGGAAAAYASFDVLVVPSIWLENSPLVIHEAFQAGVPVIGARIGGIADLIGSRGGWLYDPASPSDLARILAALSADRTKVEEARRSLPTVKTMDEDAAEWEERYLAVRTAFRERSA